VTPRTTTDLVRTAVTNVGTYRSTYDVAVDTTALVADFAARTTSYQEHSPVGVIDALTTRAKLRLLIRESGAR
jgi:hypothetical protein